MLKKTIKRILRASGYDIIRYKAPVTEEQKSIKTKNLSYYETITGKYYLPTDAKADVVANTIINNGIFDKEVVDLASRYIESGTTVLDVGANFGQMSILFSNMVGDEGKVHSFDADDWVFQIFQKNIAANSKENIIVPHFGAVHNIDNITLIFPEQNFVKFDSYGSYGIDYTATTGRKVKSITIDSLNIQGPISFMKIDIQGGDLQAMQGAVKTIEKNNMAILFEYEYQLEDKYSMKFQDYIDFVDLIGYRFEKVINGHNFLILSKLGHN